MMYKIVGHEGDCYRISFDASHPIYKAHFPGNPITPGVCLLEIIGYLIEQKMGRPVKLVRAKNIKFLSVLNPLSTPQADFKLQIKSERPQLEVQTAIESMQGVIAKMTTYYE